MNRRTVPLPLLKAWDEVYAQIPALACKGLCHESCGMVPMSAFEWHRIAQSYGGKVPGVRMADGQGAFCPILTTQKKCERYQIRPVLCRLWGVVESMKCPHGCKPERYLTEEEGFELLHYAEQLGMGPSSEQCEIVFHSTVKSPKNPT
jgi:hypothetical protein